MLGVAAVIAVYTVTIVTRAVISPEIGQAYLTLTSVSTFGDVLRKFLVHTETWYRPLTFYLTNFIIFHIIDIHNVFLIKVLSVAFILLNGLIVAWLSKCLFDSTLTERILVLSLIVTHPIYYAIAYDGSGIVDPFVNIFLNLFVISFLSLLEDGNPMLGSRRRLDDRARVWLALLCCFFLLCAITSQERGVAVYAMAGALYVFYNRHQIRALKMPRGKAAAAVIAFCCITLALYARYVIRFKGVWGGKDYRLDFEPEYILSNLPKCIELPFRLFCLKMGKVYDVHDEIWFNLFALPFVAALFGYAAATVRSDDRQEKNRLAILTILYSCSLPIPVYCGGNVWHFYTAALYVSIGMGRAIWFWLRAYNTRLQVIALGSIFLLLAVSTVRGIDQELAPGSGHLKSMMLVPRALLDRTLQSIPFKPQVVYYDTDGYGAFTWPFGGQGNLFKYLYSDPSIIEIALVHGKVLASDRALCAKTVGKPFLAFGFNMADLSWHGIEHEDYCVPRE